MIQGNTQENQSETKERILYAAKKEFAEKGYEGARIGSIARRAKANQALVHYYFDSKQNLYIEVLHRLFGVHHTDWVNERLGELGLTISEHLHAIIYLLVNFHLEATDPDLSIIMAREVAEEHMRLKPLIMDYLIPRLELLEAVIIKGVESGEFSTRNPLLMVVEMTSFMMTYVSSRHMYRGTKLYKRMYGRGDKDEVVNFLVESTFKALRPYDRPLKIPALSASVFRMLDQLVSDIRKKQLWKIDIK